MIPTWLEVHQSSLKLVKDFIIVIDPVTDAAEEEESGEQGMLWAQGATASSVGDAMTAAEL